MFLVKTYMQAVIHIGILQEIYIKEKKNI